MDRREQLLNSAEQLARTKGIDGFSYADIASEIGIRKPSIHHHFPQKADLALALIKRYSERFREALNQVSGRNLSAGDKLSLFLDIYRDALQGGDSVCLCVAFSTGRESLTDPVLSEINAFHDHALSWLEKVFKDGSLDHSISHVGDPKFESAAALACVEGGQLIARAAGQLEPFDKATETLRRRIAR